MRLGKEEDIEFGNQFIFHHTRYFITFHLFVKGGELFFSNIQNIFGIPAFFIFYYSYLYSSFSSFLSI